MDAVLPLLMRWLHVASVIVLIGGVFYARVVAGDTAPGFKPVAYWGIGGIVISGFYNFMNKSLIPPHYNLWLGIKVLLALHVFAVTILYRGNKRRSLTGVLMAGALILGIAEYLRWISLQ
jgi:hypothetical protein